MSVAVEIIQDPANVIVGHHHAIKEIQTLTINTADQRDTIRITVDNPDGGEYYLTFMNPSTQTTTMSSAITDNQGPAAMRSDIRGYWVNDWSSDIDCTRIMYDADTNETDDKANAV